MSVKTEKGNATHEILSALEQRIAKIEDGEKEQTNEINKIKQVLTNVEKPAIMNLPFEYGYSNFVNPNIDCTDKRKKKMNKNSKKLKFKVWNNIILNSAFTGLIGTVILDLIFDSNYIICFGSLIFSIGSGILFYRELVLKNN